jgi:hypothetical protein
MCARQGFTDARAQFPDCVTMTGNRETTRDSEWKALLSEAEQRWHVLSALFPDGRQPGKYASDLNIAQNPMLGIRGSIC